MEITQIGLGLLVLVVCATAGQLFNLPMAEPCYKDSDCADHSCCAKKSGQIIMSRAVHITQDPGTVKGRCKPFLKQREWCGGIWRQNGQCGCDPSLRCHWYPPSTFPNASLGKRKMMAGKYICEPKHLPRT